MMKKVCVKVVLLVFSMAFLFVVSGCGDVDIWVKPNLVFKKGDAITVLPLKNDGLNLEGEIEASLLRQGFNVVSNTVASDMVKATAQVIGGEKGSISEGEVTYSKNYKSVYSLAINYGTQQVYTPPQYFYGVPIGGGVTTYVTSFNANLTDMRTGEILINAKLTGRVEPNDLLDKFNKAFSGYFEKPVAAK